MSVKEYCKMCTKLCRKNQNVLKCRACKSSMHRKCVSISKAQFSIFTDIQGSNPYTCEICIEQQNHGIPTQNDQGSIANGRIPKVQISSNKTTHDNRNSRETTGGPASSSNESERSDFYYSFENITSKLNPRKDFFVLHLNIDSLVKYIDEVKSLISQTPARPDIICLTETRLTDKKIDWQLQLVQIENYFIPEKSYDNSPTNAGGVVIYFHNSLENYIKHKPELRLDVVDCESAFFEVGPPEKSNEVSCKKTKLLIGCIYRHPRRLVRNTTEFISKLYAILEQYSNSNSSLAE